MASWLTGSPANSDEEDSPATRLNLPKEGPGALAPLWRRIVALVIDWFAALAIATAVWGTENSLLPLAVFGVSTFLLVAMIGSTLGHRLLGLRVVPLADPARATLPGFQIGPGVMRAALRTVLLCLVIPAAVWDADGRSLHDRFAGTVILRHR